MSKKQIVICGDSFSYGIGCENLHTEPYGVLVSKHFDWDLIRLARGSASNYAIFLQGMYAADLPEKPHLIILSQTSYDRIEWFSENKPEHFYSKSFLGHSLLNLNYHEYPPHFEAQPHHDSPMDFYLKDNKDYNPLILSEQVGGIDDCLKTRNRFSEFGFYKRMKTEPNEKLELIRDYCVTALDHSIKRNYDIGVLLQAYTYIKKKGINCIVLSRDVDIFSNYFDPKDIMYQDWFELAKIYPDTIGSLHTSGEGHADTAKRLIAKIEELQLG